MMNAGVLTPEILTGTVKQSGDGVAYIPGPGLVPDKVVTFHVAWILIILSPLALGPTGEP